MSIAFYDRDGSAVAYSDDQLHIFLFAGEPVAYLDADAVYAYRGDLMGWFEGGWLRDRDGRCVAFSEHALGGPLRPAKRAWPAQGLKQTIPVQDRMDPRGLRPTHSNAWSAQTTTQFFTRQPRRWPGNLGDTGPER